MRRPAKSWLVCGIDVPQVLMRQVAPELPRMAAVLKMTVFLTVLSKSKFERTFVYAVIEAICDPRQRTKAA